MRVTALVLAILGVVVALGVGLLFLFSFGMVKDSLEFRLIVEILRSPETPETVRQPMRAALTRQMALPYFLLATVPFGIFGGLLAMERRRILAGLLLLVSAAGPVILSLGYYLVVAQPPRGGRPVANDGNILVLLGLGCAPALFLGLAALFAFMARPPAATDVSN